MARELLECIWSVSAWSLVQTLMDPDKRAAYDALMGFTSGAINPFNDRSHAADKVPIPWHDALSSC